MTETERIVRTFHESWDLRDPKRGASVIAQDCRFEDVARGELQIGPDGYTRDYERWRSAFPDGEVKVINVVVDGDWAVVRSILLWKTGVTPTGLRSANTTIVGDVTHWSGYLSEAPRWDLAGG